MATSGNQMYESSHSTISSPSSFPTRYDVYFSYRSVDTGIIFVEHLRTALSLKGMQTVCYESELEGLEFIPSIFLSTIEMSKIIVVVLSENYASSKWCLDELVEILKLKRRGKHQVVSIFYDVDPTHVRRQTGKFGVAFQKHADKKNKVETWKAALAEIGSLPGYHLPFSQSGLDKELLSKIVETVEHYMNLESDSIDMESGYSTVFPLSSIIKNSTTFKEVRALLLKTTNLNTFKWQNIVQRISGGFPVSMGLLERLSSQDLTENISKPESPQNLNLSGSPSLIPERMQVQLDFPGRQGILSNNEELLSLIEKVSEDKLLNSKFVSVMNLNVIRLRNSELLEIPDNFSFPDLKMIFLLNLVDVVPSSFFERMPALEILDMSETSIKNLPPSISKLIKLKELLLRRCELLTELPDEIGALVNLKVLDISGCRNLAGIPESIYSLQSLSSMDLRDCKIMTNLPEGIRKMGSLQYLYLSGCSSLVEFHGPEFSINRISTTGQADKMEVLLDFHGTEGTLFDITELLSLMKLVLEYQLLKSKFVEVVNLKVIHIRNYRLSQIPDNLCFPNLEMLVLQPNIDFSYIPSFFELMPTLKVLDMSHTTIKTLPYWVYQLTKLEELILRYCELLIELPHEVSALKNLKVLDLEGTDLVCFPEELKELIELKCLKFSLYDAESYRKNKDIVAIIPRNTLSKLTQLEELSINVDPQEVWCGAAMEAVMEDLPSLRKLKLLKLYLPTTKLLQDLLELKGENGLPIYQNLYDFTFVIGPHAQHFISRLPCDLEEEFLKLKKCLKYINGEDSTPKLAEALKHANALYLDRHWTLQKLSVFKFEDLIELKFCLLVDCNEMQTLFDGSDFNLGIVNNEDKFLSLQYLAIHYLRKLEVIWKGPGVGCCLHSLKLLVVHTCPNLTTIFTPVLVEYLVNLREIEVEDCPKIKTLVAEDQSHLKSKEIFPRLKKLSLLYLPELVSMFDGFSIGPELENIVIYDCPKLERLPSVGVYNKEVIEVKGESEWWNSLKWNESEFSGGRPYRLHAFSESDTDEDLQDELAPRYGNTLHLLVEDCNST